MRIALTCIGSLAATMILACGAAGPMTGAATLTSASADPCRGLRFDADGADARCLHHGVAQNTPPASALQVSLAAPAVARSGFDAGLVVTIRNVTSEPLLIDVDDACGTFEAQASNATERSFETDCFGTCGRAPDPHVLRVTLEPNGVVTKRVKFFAVQTRDILDEHQECIERTVGGLSPGDYDLRITLPWTDPIEDVPDATRPRVLEASLRVTP